MPRTQYTRLTVPVSTLEKEKLTDIAGINEETINDVVNRMIEEAWLSEREKLCGVVDKAYFESAGIQQEAEDRAAEWKLNPKEAEALFKDYKRTYDWISERVDAVIRTGRLVKHSILRPNIAQGITAILKSKYYTPTDAITLRGSESAIA
jgi:hypothetical protein